MVKLNLELETAGAWALADFLKRAGFSDYRDKAGSDDEAYRMQAAAEVLRRELAGAGIDPR